MAAVAAEQAQMETMQHRLVAAQAAQGQHLQLPEAPLSMQAVVVVGLTPCQRRLAWEDQVEAATAASRGLTQPMEPQIQAVAEVGLMPVASVPVALVS